MGTAILATAGAALPVRVPGLRTLLTACWVLALVLMLVLLCARALHWRHHSDQARAHLLDPATAPFHGCSAMALLAVGGGALTVGEDLIGTRAAVALDAVLFTVGTVLALAAAVAVPYLMAVRHRVAACEATPVWLLPLVAPMVSAALGPLLVPYLPAGQPRQTLLLACFALFGLSLLATFVMLPVVFARLLTGGPLPSSSPRPCSWSWVRSGSPPPPWGSSPTSLRGSCPAGSAAVSPCWPCCTGCPSWGSRCCGCVWPRRMWRGPVATAWASR